ncbi:hypothetical protein D3C73_1007100 [compost metagenome]
MGGQFSGPSGCENTLVAYLVGLHAAAGIGAVAGAFIVDHPAGRLHQHAQALCTHAEGQVGVFVVGGLVAGVEAAQLLPQCARQHQRGAGAVIDVAQAGEAGIIGRFETAVAPATAIAEDHPARFLQAAVGIQQLAADQAGIGDGRKGVQQCLQPARLRHRIVVEQHHVATARARHAVVAGLDEAAVALAYFVAQAADLRHPLHRCVAAAVVHHEDLTGHRRRVRGQGAQAGQGMVDVVVDRNDDADVRRIAGRHREGSERLCRWQVQGFARCWDGALAVHPDPLPGGPPAAGAQAGQAAAGQPGQAIDQVADFGQGHRHPGATPA